MKKVKAVLFDLDGVLVDATEWHYEALNRALDLFGYTITRYDHLAVYNGLPTRKKLEMLSVQEGLPVEMHGLINRTKQTYTKDEILTKCRPVFEIEYMVSRLKREGHKLAVCSNSIKETVDLMIRLSGLTDYFDLLISNEDVKKPKPNPEIYSTTMKQLKVKPEETVIVEDAPQGVEAAKAAGAHVLQVEGIHEVDYFKVNSFIESIEGRQKLNSDVLGVSK